ncbi:MAG: hypothetical protein H7Y11_13615 [Armatimonadetes bacterium]|nr:hypothetical protein [Anaerolineae bacterium]
MRFILFTDKTVAQSVSAIHERIQLPASATRANIEGYVEKSGKFSVGLTASVIGRFTRTTRMDGQIGRENGSTVIRGQVADGVGPRGQVLVLVGMALMAVLLLVQGQPIFAVLVLLAGAVVYIPLRGDFENGDKLLIEVERTLKASPKPPKATVKPTAAIANGRGAPKKPATGTSKPVAAKSAVAKKTPGSSTTLGGTRIPASTSKKPTTATPAKTR